MLVSLRLMKRNEHPRYDEVAACNGYPILGGVVNTGKFMLMKRVMQIIVHVFRLLVFVYFSAPIADFYSMSYLWFSGLSVLTSFVVGIIMSLILGKFTTDNKSCTSISFRPTIFNYVKTWTMKPMKKLESRSLSSEMLRMVRNILFPT